MSTKKRGPYIPYVQRTTPENSPTIAATEIRSDTGSRWMSPVPQPSTFSSWTPALAPIVGSPSIPPPAEMPNFDQEEEELERERAREREQAEAEQARYEQEAAAVIPPPPIIYSGDIEQGVGPSTSEKADVSQPRRTRGFIGGFIAELKKIPAFMAKDNPRGSGIAADGNGPPQRVSYYSSASPSVHGSPLPSQTTQSQFRPSTVPIEELYESELDDEASQARSQTPYDEQLRNENYDGTTAVHEPIYTPPTLPTDPSVMSSPMQVGSVHLADFEKTQTPFPFTNPDDKALMSYVDRLHRVLTDIYYLPWVSIQVASEYIPAEDSSRGRKRKGEPKSWYTPRRRKEKSEMDFTASPAMSSPPPMIQTIPPTPTLSGMSGIYSHFSRTTRSVVPSEGRLTLTASQYTYAPTHTHRSHSRAPSESGTAFREMRSPGIATTVSAAYPSPGASSHGLGRHSISESIHYASPGRNMRPYPSVASAMSSPQTRLGSEYFTPKY